MLLEVSGYGGGVGVECLPTDAEVSGWIPGVDSFCVFTLILLQLRVLSLFSAAFSLAVGLFFSLSSLYLEIFDSVLVVMVALTTSEGGGFAGLRSVSSQFSRSSYFLHCPSQFIFPQRVSATQIIQNKLRSTIRKIERFKKKVFFFLS